jgi:hypothetical protein
MKNTLNINIPRYQPLAKWILEKLLKLGDYNITIYFCSLTEAKRRKYTPKNLPSKTGVLGTYVPRLNLIWINNKNIESGDTLIVMAHELRHYYQWKLNLFPLTDADVKFYEKIYEVKSTRGRWKKEYDINLREADAIKFQEMAVKRFVREFQSGKLKLSNIF